jgi:hypothetical protein
MSPSKVLNAEVLMLGDIHHAHAEFDEISKVATVHVSTRKVQNSFP